MKNWRIFKLLFFIVGVCLSIVGVVYAIGTTISFGSVLIILLGAFLIFASVYYERFMNSPRPIVRMFRYAFVIGFALWLVFSAMLYNKGNVNHATYNEDVLIVFGCAVNGDTPSKALALRLEEALDYVKENPEVYVAVTGGRGYGEHISEADAMATYLINHGVDSRRIIREDKATSTYENVKNTKEIIQQRLGDGLSYAAITSDFHVVRARKLARQFGINAGFIGAPTEWYMMPVNYIRETLALAKYYLLRR